MTPARNGSTRIKRGFFAAAAVLLLMFTFADLAFPSICGEESQPLDGSAVVVADCFCCCGHIIVSPVIAVSRPPFPAALTMTIPASTTPQPPLDLTDPPPRLA